MSRRDTDHKGSWPLKILAAACISLFLVPTILLASPQSAKTSKPAQKTAAGQQRVKPQIPTADHSQTNKVFLEHADLLRYEQQFGVGAEDQYQVLTGNVKLRKGGMYMYCDSAYLYEATNSIEAFGNVRMEQGDTLFVNADYLDYNGLIEEAVLYADAGKKVRLRNREVTLTTDIFHYDMANEIGYYDVGGELTDKQNKLTSLEGEYYPQTKDAYFNFDVHLTSRRDNDVLYINTDSLEYNTATHIAELVSESEIINSDGTIYTSSGTYNTNSGQADLFKRSTVHTRRGNTLTGDTLYYDRQKQYGEAFGNMVLTDSARQSALFGDYGFYDEVRDSAFVTGRALGKEYSKGDTLYLHGDTIIAYVDLVDSTKVTNVFHRVRFYRYDVQGLCDSLSMTERDSIIYMYRSPIIWSGERQIFGNQINAHMADSTIDWARLPLTGMMSEHIAEDCYDQLSGLDVTVWFSDSTVRRMYVEGNVQLIGFPMESDSTYNKYVYVESSYMDSYFDNNSIESIHFWPETTSKVTPLYLAKRNRYFLPKFKWYEDIRPRSPEDVFSMPEEMLELFRQADPIVPTSKGPNEPKRESNKPNPNAPAPSREMDLKPEARMPRDGGDGRPPKPELTGGLQPEVPTIESSPAEPESEPLAEPAENEADKLD